MTTARAALTTGSATEVNISRPNGMPNSGGQNEPSGAARMDLPPIQCQDDTGHSDGDQDGQRGGDLDRDDQCEQGHGDQGLAEPERRTDHGGESDHGQYV